MDVIRKVKDSCVQAMRWEPSSPSKTEFGTWPKSDSAPPRGARWKQDIGPGQRRDLPDTIPPTLKQPAPASFRRSARLGPLPPYKGAYSRRGNG
jgi:hypothetical protein